MHSLHLAVVSLVLAPFSSAQVPPTQDEVVHGRTGTSLVSDEVVPGLQEASQSDLIDWEPPVPADAQPVPMPGFSGRHVGEVRGLVVDLDSDRTVEFDLGSPALRAEDWLSGRTPREEEFEYESFGSLASVTSKAYPWSTQCRITFSQAGVNYVGSGILLDAQTVLTAGHVVHAGAGGGFSSNVVVRPAFDGDSDAFGTSSAAQLYTFTGWSSSGDTNWDMGFIRLRRPVGYLTGWLGAFYNTSSSFWSSTAFRAAGYPGGCFSGAPNRLYSTSGTWDGIATHRVEAVLTAPCWIGGMSGGGVYYTDAAGSRYCGATISYAWGYPTQTTRFGCNRMTQTKFDTLVNTVIPAGLSTTAKDLVALKARTGNTTIRRGTAPVSMNYNVYNHSGYNPASATTNVNVYLSQDSTITTADTRIQSHAFTWNFGVKTGVTINMTPPVIPSGTAPGTYYLGILITSSDSNNANNATVGWDAQRITVTL